MTLADLKEQLAIAEAKQDRWTEGKLLNKIFRIVNPLKGINGSAGLTVQQRFDRRIWMGSSGCLYWCGQLDDAGYGILQAMGETKAHRISYRLHRGEIPKGLKVLHKCDVRNCVNPNHLFLGTQLDNMRDCRAKGRLGTHKPLRGEKSSSARYSDALVSQIRADFNTGNYTQIFLAKKYGVSPMNVSRYVRNLMR